MIRSDLHIRYVAKPCTNFKAYYFGRDPDPKSTFLSGLKTHYLNDVEKLSDLPDKESADNVYIEWDSIEENDSVFKENELPVAINNLLSYYKLGNHLTLRKDLDLAPLFSFANKYGMFFTPSRFNPPIKKTIALTTIIDHLNSVEFIRFVLSLRTRSSRDIRDILQLLCKALITAVRNYSITSNGKSNLNKDTCYCGYAPIGFVVVGTSLEEISNMGLYFILPFDTEWRDDLIGEYENLQNDPTYVPDWFIPKLQECALASITRYIEQGGIKYSPGIDDNKVVFFAKINSPTVYYLLTIKNTTFDKKSYNAEYAKEVYPRLTSYFRTKKDREQITEEQYEHVKVRAKVLRNNHSYHEAKKIIQEELGICPKKRSI